MTPGLGLAHFWSQADAVIRLTAYVLLAMSVLSWGVILWKLWAWRRARRAAARLESFWSARSIDEAIALLKPADADRVFVPLAAAAAEAAEQPGVAAAERPSVEGAAGETPLAGRIERPDRIARALRQRIDAATARLEAGQTFLASIGSTAPFVGLFGTVWGIYHALLNIASSGSLALAQIAGPVGEALIMTAFGLLVAVPALLAYNAFTRVNRLLLARLDGFAHDLHACLTSESFRAEGFRVAGFHE